ncbi:5859_t:CDS:2, partial [Paraglomus occultum]
MVWDAYCLLCSKNGAVEPDGTDKGGQAVLAENNQLILHHEQGGEGEQFLVQSFSSLWSTKSTSNEKDTIKIEYGCGKIEDGKFEDILISGFGSCPNAGRILQMFPSLGQLFRIDTMGDTVESRQECRHKVVVADQLNVPMVVHLIANEFDHQQISNLIGIEIKDSTN